MSKFVFLLALVGLAAAAPAVDITTTTVRPLGVFPGMVQPGMVNSLPTVGSLPVNNIQPLPNSNLPVDNVVTPLPVPQKLDTPLVNSVLPIDGSVPLKQPLLLPFVHPPITGSFPWWYFIQQNPQLLSLYHYWLIQQQFPWWNLGLNNFGHQWWLHNLGMTNLNGQFTGLPTNSNLFNSNLINSNLINPYLFNLNNLPVHTSADVINARATPIPVFTNTQRYNFQNPTINNIGTTGFRYQSPLFKTSPMKHDIYSPMYPYYGYQNYYYNYPYYQYPYGGYYPYGQYPYGQSFGQYPYVNQALTGSNIVVDQGIVGTTTNINTQTDQLLNNNVQSQPVIQPTIV